MVAETVSEDGNENFDSSSSDDSDIEEIDDANNDDISKEEAKANKFNDIQETISIDNSNYSIPCDRDSFASSDQVLAKAESEYDNDLIEDKLAKAVSSSDIENELNLQSEHDFIDDFDIIQSQISESIAKKPSDYIENKKESVSDQIKEELIENEELKISDGKKEIKPNEEEAQQRESIDEIELLKMNKSVSQKEQPKPEIIEDVIEEVKEEIQNIDEMIEEEVKQENEFNPIQRESIAVSCAKAQIIKDDQDKRINIMHRALENINFVFGNPEKRLTIAQVDESESEKSQEFVITCKPGKLAKKRWRVVNNSNIAWPKKTKLKCQNEGAVAEVPQLTALNPGDKVDISINIKIKEDETANKVEVYVFRFWNKFYGYFGEPLIATVEITPEFAPIKMEDILQEDKLKELLESDEINPIYYEMASDLCEEGLGTFEECLKALLQCKENYSEAREALQKKNENKE